MRRAAIQHAVKAARRRRGTFRANSWASLAADGGFRHYII